MAHLQSMEVTRADAQGVFNLCKRCGRDEVNVDEFILGLLRLHGTAKAVDVVSLVYENRMKSMETARTAKQAQRRFDNVLRHLEEERRHIRTLSASIEDVHDKVSYVATIMGQGGSRNARKPRL